MSESIKRGRRAPDVQWTGGIIGMAARPIYLGLGLGHAATLEKSENGGVLTIHAPRGSADVTLDIVIAADGPTLRVRDTTLYAPPATRGSSGRLPVEGPATPSPLPPRPPAEQAAPGPLAAPVAPVVTAKSLEPRLSLQQYASLRAGCMNASPEKLAEVRARFALDEAGDTAEAEAWARKFADPVVFESYRHYFQMFRSTASPGQGTASPAPPKPSPSPSAFKAAPAVPSTQALARVLTLGEHATMTAELAHGSADAIYAKYALGDGAVRAQVLKMCEERLRDAQALQTWKQLHAIALQKIEAVRK